jgi:hypothetical protein
MGRLFLLRVGFVVDPGGGRSSLPAASASSAACSAFASFRGALRGAPTSATLAGVIILPTPRGIDGVAARERLLACGVVEGPREVQVALRRVLDAFEDERGNEVLPFRLERVGGQVIHLQSLF